MSLLQQGTPGRMDQRGLPVPVGTSTFSAHAAAATGAGAGAAVEPAGHLSSLAIAIQRSSSGSNDATTRCATASGLLQQQQQQQQHSAPRTSSNSTSISPLPVAAVSYHDQTVVLTEEVRRHPCVYSKAGDEDGKGDKRASRQAAWRTIGQRVGMSVDECQKKFKNIRDRYVKSLKEYETSGHVPRWRYFHQLGFLKDFVKRKSAFSPVPGDLMHNEDPGLSTDFASISSLVGLSQQLSSVPVTPAKQSSVPVSSNDLVLSDTLVSDICANASMSPPSPAFKPAKRKSDVHMSSQPAKRVSLGGYVDGGSYSNVGADSATVDSVHDEGSEHLFRQAGDHIDIFAASISCQMRQLTPQAVDLAKLKIQQVMFEVKYQSNTSFSLATSQTNNSGHTQ